MSKSEQQPTSTEDNRTGEILQIIAESTDTIHKRVIAAGSKANTIGRVYTPARWIGNEALCYTVWTAAEQIPAPTTKTKPARMPNPFNPSETVTVIQRRIGKHLTRNTAIGYINIPTGWIGKDVSICRMPSTAQEGQE